MTKKYFYATKEIRLCRIITLEERFECGEYWVITDVLRRAGINENNVNAVQFFAFNKLKEAKVKFSEIESSIKAEQYKEFKL